MSDFRDVFSMEGRVAAVTGAASGIGCAVAEVLAGAGAEVFLGDLDGAGAERVAAAIREAGGRARADRLDVSDRGAVTDWIEESARSAGRLDALANVAGIPADGTVDSLDESTIDHVLAVNLKGTLFACQAAGRVMHAESGASIVNVASAAIDFPAPGIGLYAMTKAAVAQLTRTLAVELGDRGIRVNAIAPGWTRTRFTERHLLDEDGTLDAEQVRQTEAAMRARSPLGLVGEPLDQAWLVLYLLSAASRFCTGQIWRANGGAAMPG